MARNFNKNSRNRLALILSIVLILILVVGGTISFVVANSLSVKNNFERTYVESEVNSDLSVTNLGNTEAYIRAAIVVNWMDADGNVRGIAPVAGADYELSVNTEDWYLDNTTGFYYYKPIVEVNGVTGDTTDILVSDVTLKVKAPEGYELTVEVVAEAIQATGTKNGTPAYSDAWGITVYGS